MVDIVLRLRGFEFEPAKIVGEITGPIENLVGPLIAETGLDHLVSPRRDRRLYSRSCTDAAVLRG